jgi:hypothetical protein
MRKPPFGADASDVKSWCVRVYVCEKKKRHRNRELIRVRVFDQRTVARIGCSVVRTTRTEAAGCCARGVAYTLQRQDISQCVL